MAARLSEFFSWHDTGVTNGAVAGDRCLLVGVAVVSDGVPLSWRLGCRAGRSPVAEVWSGHLGEAGRSVPQRRRQQGSVSGVACMRWGRGAVVSGCGVRVYNCGSLRRRAACPSPRQAHSRSSQRRRRCRLPMCSGMRVVCTYWEVLATSRSTQGRDFEWTLVLVLWHSAGTTLKSPRLAVPR